ncbi:uncharacterized protein LOC112904236 [Agrilus planipennis]|uniref:Uncharacterized protein LOC112904236 n=1 Tax=Agrilus planipennis TaxID=224129 RepID=A0A7F5QWP4_AGRPL|nr:uncharacterized protein LOC112904236 [Agrilus planipennis]
MGIIFYLYEYTILNVRIINLSVCITLNVPYHSLFFIDAECAYGETKHIDCNSCSCTKNGYWACTRMACISGGLNDASSGEYQYIFYLYEYTILNVRIINLSVCITLNVPYHSLFFIDAECAYGETKHIDCNSCSCTKNGYWACTRMACISGGLNDASSGEYQYYL